ncbi:hypothetical protein C1J03_06275 [Sulfitobacter sp. SK012]|uniref:hypothetical protein n=1 Tax=Sulfitobacter sp. SK012 TaxID=1389005 RepID=UPI000E0AFF3E|nr:hypothetical protein [Sulfitobacter sp. SK012]AXI45677.1 hypothetical protein C1J03_06275 [Sulfitobacter sp. SK012]
MIRSLNEVAALAGKAARGAGAPAAQATRFGQAAVQHLCAGRDPQALTRALAALPGGPILDLPLALMQQAEAQVVEGGFETKGWDTLARSYVAALPFAATLNEKNLLWIDLNTPAKRSPVARCDLPEDLCADWQALAAKTLVPETDASRLGGAGAGLLDND